MRIKVLFVWTCTLVISLFVESCHTHKPNIHWGPQSMMYLKGKHGRRLVSEENDNIGKRSFLGWYTVLRGIQRLKLRELSKPSYIVRSGRGFIPILQES